MELLLLAREHYSLRVLSLKADRRLNDIPEIIKCRILRNDDLAQLRKT